MMKSKLGRLVLGKREDAEWISPTKLYIYSRLQIKANVFLFGFPGCCLLLFSESTEREEEVIYTSHLREYLALQFYYRAFLLSP
jgi:hypothetical protein